VLVLWSDRSRHSSRMNSMDLVILSSIDTYTLHQNGPGKLRAAELIFKSSLRSGLSSASGKGIIFNALSPSFSLSSASYNYLVASIILRENNKIKARSVASDLHRLRCPKIQNNIHIPLFPQLRSIYDTCLPGETLQYVLQYYIPSPDTL
jgi:hypothetical protein